MPGAEEILVGIDGSVHGRAATAWALAEARTRNCGVLLVHVSQIASDLWVTTPAIRRGLRELARPVVEHGLAFAAGLDPTVPVRGRLMLGNPHRALVTLSAGAALTVLGRQGRGAIATHLVGSVCRTVMSHAHGAVVAVAPDAPPAIHPLARVVVAVGDRPASLHHLEFGIEQARRHGIELVVLHAWQPPRWSPHRAGDPATELAEATRRLSASIAAYAFLPSCGPIRPAVLAGSPIRVLREFCQPSDLLVLGRHRRERPLPVTLGPVTSAALQKLSCAVSTAGDAVMVTEPAPATERSGAYEQSPGVIAY